MADYHFLLLQWSLWPTNSVTTDNSRFKRRLRRRFRAVIISCELLLVFPQVNHDYTTTIILEMENGRYICRLQGPIAYQFDERSLSCLPTHYYACTLTESKFMLAV